MIDLRTLYPFDMDAVEASVKKTGRCVIVHEAPKTGGFGAEIAARIMERCFLHLEAPVQRVAGFDTIMPYYKLELEYLPRHRTNQSRHRRDSRPTEPGPPSRRQRPCVRHETPHSRSELRILPMAATKQPADQSHFILPDLGEGVHEAELISWKVKPGDHVKEHQTMAEMETDKALVEVPSPWTGVIDELRGSEGEIINVGSILVTYKVEGASTPPAAPRSRRQPAPASRGRRSPSPRTEDQGTVVGTMSGTLEVSSRFSRTPEHEAGTRNGQHGTTAGGKAMATPAVRRVARELGLEIDRVPGTGRGGTGHRQ